MRDIYQRIISLGDAVTETVLVITTAASHVHALLDFIQCVGVCICLCFCSSLD